MFPFNYNDTRAFNRTTGCIFKCETKMKLAKTIKKMDFYTTTFLHNVIFYQILMLFKFLKISYVPFMYRKGNITQNWPA